MQRKLLVSTIAVAGAAIVYFAQPEDTPAPEIITEQNHHDHGLLHTDNDVLMARNGQVLSTGKDMFKPKLPEPEPAESAAHQASEVFDKDTVIWRESDVSKEILEKRGLIPADVADEAYIELDLQELHAVEVGDFLDLYIPQLGGSYTAEVDFIQQHDNGDRTVEAHIPGAGSLYSAVITLGEEAVYGNLATQRDVYILEGFGRHAWLAPKSSMISNHQEHLPSASATPGNTEAGSDVFNVSTELSPRK